MKKQNSLESDLYKAGAIAFLIVVPLMFLYLKVFVPIYHFPCMMVAVFGLYCPGCGGTRAVSALLHGNILQSLWYHPLVLYCVVIYGGFMVTHTLERLHIGRIKGWKFHDWYLYVAVVIAIGNWILRNVLLLKFHITL